jgi:hypothetical protein
MGGLMMEAPTVPNTGRILDYWLGGTHHYPPDVAAAQAFDDLFPAFPQVFRTLRQFIGRATQAIAAEGIDRFVVFGAGVPTQDNVHEAVPGSRVLYTDIDATNVRLGQQILRDQPHVDYAHCDVRDISTLDRSLLDEVLGPTGPIGVVVVGVAAFLTDEQLKQSLQDLYDLTPAGSYLALDCDGPALHDYPEVLGVLAGAGEPLCLRTPDRISPLIGPWVLSTDGIRPVQAWPHWGTPTSDAAFMYGLLAHKPSEVR